MKKLLWAAFTVIIVFIAGVYLLIPGVIHISDDKGLPVTQGGIFRNLVENNDWSKWWPGKTVDISNKLSQHYAYQNFNYIITNKTINTIEMGITNTRLNARSVMTIVPTHLDSVKIYWEAVLPTSYNPVKRLQIYFAARSLEQDIKKLLRTVQTYFSKQENVYGIDIKYDHVKDSFLISTFENSKTYPTTDRIYKMIDELKKYAVSKSATITGNPMLNISSSDNSNWTTRVAIPVDRRLESTGNISYKWMLGGGNILITEVKGDQSVVNKALEQLNNYVNDFRRIPPAIPFQSLVTDRSKEPDSTKWITKIYFPIM